MAFSYTISYGQKSITYLFVGTYTAGKPDKGIFIYAFDTASGQLKKISTGKNITNPSFLTLSPDGNNLYACTDTKLPIEGTVSAFRFDHNTGLLSFINKQAAGGTNPVYVSIHPNGKYVVVANYDSGSVAAFTVAKDGSLSPRVQLIPFKGSGPNKERQENAHIHAAVFSPDYRYVYLPDLGADKIRVLGFDTAGLQPLRLREDASIETIPGSGPRHMVFHPTLNYAYCVEELSGTVSTYSYNNGKLAPVQRIFSYAGKHNTYSGADIHISPDGLFLYASNRGDEENTLSIFPIDGESGHLTLIGHQDTFGEHPRNFTIDPTGKFLLVANQISNSIVVFKRDRKTGLLRRIGGKTIVPRPSCLQMRTYVK